MDHSDQFNQKNNDLNYDEMVEQVIEEIKALPDVELMFGTRFSNRWEEIAYRAQVEKIHCSCEVLNLCRGVVEKLSDKLVQKYWLLLDSKGKWYFANDYPEGDVKTKKPGLDDMRESVAEELCKRVDQAADNYALITHR